MDELVHDLRASFLAPDFDRLDHGHSSGSAHAVGTSSPSRRISIYGSDP